MRWVPGAFALALVVPKSAVPWLGVGSAHACVTVGPVKPPPDPTPGFTWLRPSKAAPTHNKPTPIGTDGFVAITAEGVELSAADAEAAMKLEVRDAAGAIVMGHVRLLKERHPGRYLFGWEANQRLDIGAKLTMTLSGSPISGDTPLVGGVFSLVVAGEPVELPTPELSLSGWRKYLQGAGPKVSCAVKPSLTSCGPTGDRIDVPSSFNQLAAASVRWEIPSLPVGVAWEARLEASASDSDVLLPEWALDYFAEVPDLWPGLVMFPTAAARHCVTLVTRDLRTGDERRADSCSSPPATTEYDSDAPHVEACLSPPGGSASVAWCYLKAELAPAECEAILKAAGTTDPLGSAGAPSDVATNDGDRPRTSKGCQLGAPAPSPSSTAWLAISAAAIGAARRRRR